MHPQTLVVADYDTLNRNVTDALRLLNSLLNPKCSAKASGRAAGIHADHVAHVIELLKEQQELVAIMHRAHRDLMARMNEMNARNMSSLVGNAALTLFTTVGERNTIAELYNDQLQQKANDSFTLPMQRNALAIQFRPDRASRWGVKSFATIVDPDDCTATKDVMVPFGSKPHMTGHSAGYDRHKSDKPARRMYLGRDGRFKLTRRSRKRSVRGTNLPPISHTPKRDRSDHIMTSIVT